MSGFADGQVRAPEAVKARVENSVIERFGKGKPHGLLTVKDATGIIFMHAVAGGGDRSGTSEVAYAMMPSHWNPLFIAGTPPGPTGIPKKYATRVLTAIVNEWAPEVRRIGLGIGLDPVADKNIIAAFRCFGGDALNQLDATASPSNPGSWKALQTTGFRAAMCNVASDEVRIDFDHKEFPSLQVMEVEMVKLYDATLHGDQALVVGKRYRMIDPAGKVRTVSKHDRYNRMKYHFENKSFVK